MSQYYIYKIVSDDCPEFIYVGSTKSLKDRKYHHKSNCNNSNRRIYNSKLYKTIRDHGGWDNFRMVLVEECGDISRNQATIREEHHRLQLNASMNSKKAFSSEDDKKQQQKQYNEANRDKIKEDCKKYYEANRDKIKERRKEYRKANQDKIKEQDKKYREASRDKRKEYEKANRVKINEQKKEKVTCECGCVVSREFLSKHKKTTKHKQLICPVV